MGENRESGFINSEPCIAEFMSDVPLISQALVSSSVSQHPDASYCQSFNGGLPASPSRADLALAGTPETPELGVGAGGGKYDYTWMKDKVKVRKSDPPQTVPDIGNKLFIHEIYIALPFSFTYLNGTGISESTWLVIKQRVLKLLFISLLIYFAWVKFHIQRAFSRQNIFQ